jgi:two-component system NtrC family sensor kinase
VKVAIKLALAVLPGALVIVAAAAFLEIGRDRAEFEADQIADDRAAAGAFADGMGKLWETVGEGPVRTAMDRIRAFEERYRVSWVDPRRTDLPVSARDALARGEPVLWHEARGKSSTWLHAVAPVRAHGEVVGAVDVAEPPPDLRAHVRRTIRATVATTLALAATMMLVTLLAGAWLVGAPISGLIAQARRVAAGDLRARSLPRQRDELGELTRELNKMLDRLESAAAQVHESTRERIDALEQLRHAERLTTVGRIASSVAHELGTPLNVVSGRARLIVEQAADSDRDGGGDGEAQGHARIIIDQSERMAKIIRQLLDYARRRPPQKEAHDLGRLAADVLPLLATLASKKRVALRLHNEAETKTAPVTADSTQVQQALTNLIVNAIQASVEGGIVDVSLRPARAIRPARAREQAGGPVDAFELSVRDYGPGMSPEVLARVFEPFFTTKPVGESTGLGLSVAQDIVDEHGGWLAAESEPGRGSRFMLFLPRRPA